MINGPMYVFFLRKPFIYCHDPIAINIKTIIIYILHCIAVSGSKSSQTYFNESNHPFSDMYASYPSGMPSPSVSDFLGSKYDLISPSTSPVNPLRKPGSVHSAGYGQQYSSVAFRPSLSLSRSASDASSLSNLS